MATQKDRVVYGIQEKLENGALGSMNRIGSTFEYVIDDRTGKGNYSLAQLFDSYMAFLEGADFIYYGSEKPSNTHTRIWIDTSQSNLDVLS